MEWMRPHECFLRLRSTKDFGCSSCYWISRGAPWLSNTSNPAKWFNRLKLKIVHSIRLFICLYWLAYSGSKKKSIRWTSIEVNRLGIVAAVFIVCELECALPDDLSSLLLRTSRNVGFLVNGIHILDQIRIRGACRKCWFQKIPAFP